MRKSAVIAALALMVATTVGCGIQPWVKPYERANLADPIMQIDRDPVSNAFRNHVFQARNAARGAESGQGGGCGCN